MKRKWIKVVEGDYLTVKIEVVIKDNHDGFVSYSVINDARFSLIADFNDRVDKVWGGESVYFWINGKEGIANEIENRINELLKVLHSVEEEERERDRKIKEVAQMLERRGFWEVDPDNFDIAKKK